MAKDFGVPTKVITNLVTEFFEKPKSAQQVLTEEQLNVLFDVMTQRNQISSIEQVFATAQQAPEAPKADDAKAFHIFYSLSLSYVKIGVGVS